jgi:hypothetical protein
LNFSYNKSQINLTKPKQTSASVDVLPLKLNSKKNELFNTVNTYLKLHAILAEINHFAPLLKLHAILTENLLFESNMGLTFQHILKTLRNTSGLTGSILKLL